jgi:hypothetical protein
MERKSKKKKLLPNFTVGSEKGWKKRLMEKFLLFIFLQILKLQNLIHPLFS